MTTCISPVVTFGLPVYNGEDYLSEAIESLLAQTCGNFELVISDNASTDATQEICREYAARDNRIRVIRQDTNIGAAGNYNFLFGEARGTFFKWCPHDDLLKPTYLEKTLALLKSDPHAVLSHSQTEIFSDEGTIELVAPDFRMSPLDAADRLHEVISKGYRCFEAVGLIRRDAAAQTNLIGRHRGGDNVFLFRLALLGKFAVVPEPLYLHRRHEKQSFTHRNDGRAYQQWFSGQSRQITFPEWTFLQKAFGTPSGIGLPLHERLRCYRVLTRYAWKRRAQLRQNLRVAAETLIFGNTDPLRRHRFFEPTEKP